MASAEIGASTHAREIMIDLLKAFEYVDRAEFAERGSRGDYPNQVSAASVVTYGFKRRLAHRGNIMREISSRSGITAGAPFATGDLWLVMSDVMHRIFEDFPWAVFVIHVVDLSYSREGEDEVEIVEELARIHNRVKEGLERDAQRAIAEAKTVALACSDQLANRIAAGMHKQGGARVVTRRKLGVDCRLFGPDGVVVGRPGESMKT